jgi:hypothetical protein
MSARSSRMPRISGARFGRTGASRTERITSATAFWARMLGEDASRIRCRPGSFARIRSFALNILRAHRVANVSEAIYTNALSLDCLLAYGQPRLEN